MIRFGQLGRECRDPGIFEGKDLMNQLNIVVANVALRCVDQLLRKGERPNIRCNNIEGQGKGERSKSSTALCW